MSVRFRLLQNGNAEQVPRNSVIDPNRPTTGDRMSIAHNEEDCASGSNESIHTATFSKGYQRGFTTDADYTLHEPETSCSVLAVELGLNAADEEQEEAENEHVSASRTIWILTRTFIR